MEVPPTLSTYRKLRLHGNKILQGTCTCAIVIQVSIVMLYITGFFLIIVSCTHGQTGVQLHDFSRHNILVSTFLP